MHPTLHPLAVRLFTTAATVLMAVTPLAACAQGHYPNRPLTLVIGFAPGGPNDIQGRQIAKALAHRLQQPVNVLNQAGSSGNPAKNC